MPGDHSSAGPENIFHHQGTKTTKENSDKQFEFLFSWCPWCLGGEIFVFWLCLDPESSLGWPACGRII
jgi:hypothetical protein